MGNGLDERRPDGPGDHAASRERIEGLIEQGASEGARAVLDGRTRRLPDYEQGNFVGPTVLDGVPADSETDARRRFSDRCSA